MSKSKIMEDELNYIVKTINLSEKLSAQEFNFNSDVKKVYCIISDAESFENLIKKESLLDSNRIYSIVYVLEQYLKQNEVELNLANTYINKLENYYTRNWFKINFVQYAIDLKEIKIAEQITSEIPDEDSGPGQYLAHRKILEYYAINGEIENFKIKTKPSKLGKFPRFGIESYKYKLIKGYAKNNGIKKAFELIENKYFEKTPSIAILRWSAHNFSIEEIENYLEQYPKVLSQTKTARADLFVSHFRKQKEVSIPQLKFEKVLAEVLSTDKDSKCGDMRCRDSLLLDLGASTLIKKQALECKKNIISPIVKRELNYAISYKEEHLKYIS